jgi:four helix bundle protein
VKSFVVVKRFAAGVIQLCVKSPKSQDENLILGRQLLRSGTSVAAHIREASRARSDEELVSKLSVALQAADESALWLQLLCEKCGVKPDPTSPLEMESFELLAILATMINRTKQKE